MSTSLLYHAFGIRGYRYRRTDYHSVPWSTVLIQRMSRGHKFMAAMSRGECFRRRNNDILDA